MTIETMTAELRIPASNFGTDHWSMLAYIETRCVDHGGTLRLAQVRCNPDRHPEMLGGGYSELRKRWQPSWGTRLKIGQLDWHDDWDCLNDLEEAGFVEILSLAVPAVALTDTGRTVAAALRAHRAEHHNYRTFEVGQNARSR